LKLDIEAGSSPLNWLLLNDLNQEKLNSQFKKRGAGRAKYTELAAEPEGMSGRGPLKELLVIVLEKGRMKKPPWKK